MQGKSPALHLGGATSSDSTLRGHFPLETDVLAEEVAAATGRLDAAALLLWAAGFCWILGYDTIYAVQDIEDDEIAVVPVTSAPQSVVQIFCAHCRSVTRAAAAAGRALSSKR